MLADWVRKWIGRIVKITLILAVLIGFMLIVLGNIGGNDETYKTMIEDFAHDATGMDARIGTLNNVRFFPNIIFDFENMGFYETPEDDIARAQIGSLRLVMSFWDVFRRTGHIKFFAVENISAAPGILLEKPVGITGMGIAEQVVNSPSFEMRGRIGDSGMTLSLPMQSQGEAYRQTYHFGPERAFSATLGEAVISGTLKRDDRGFLIENLAVSLNNKDILRDTALFINPDRIVLEKQNPDALLRREELQELFTYLNTMLATPGGRTFFSTENGTLGIIGIPLVFEHAEETP